MKKFNLLRKSLVMWVVVFLAVALPTLSYSDCEDPCSGAQDCVDPHCKGCDTGFGVCIDCCTAQTSIECADYPGCHWNTFECENEMGVACSGIAEVPKNSRTWLLVAFLLAGFGLTAALRLKKKPV
jgi:hypothetical protein